MVKHWGTFLTLSFLTCISGIMLQYKPETHCGSNKQCHVTLFIWIWHVEIGSHTILTSYHHHETHFCYQTFFCCVSPQ
jgi:hypothetical protein